MKYSLAFIVLIFILPVYSQAQISNTDCSSALFIDDPSNYCSSGRQFTNVGGGNSALPTANCFAGVSNDVYFSFTAQAQAVNVVINAEVGGDLRSPVVALFEGECGSPEFKELGCGSASGSNDIINLFVEGLTVGQTYLLRVGGSGNNAGSFQLCISNFNQPITPGQDLDKAAVLCDKSNFVIQTLSGGGDDPDEADGTCLDVGFGDSESQSSWTTWTAANDGDLTFTITPLNATDDIDFVLFELPNGVNDFSSAIVLRCMASGCAGGGPTGLNQGSSDFIETAGCPPGNNNFLAALEMEAGKVYALLINNFTSTGLGVSLTFGGSGEFLGPEADFSIKVDGIDHTATNLICDQVFKVENESDDGGIGITEYEWNFGTDASPQLGQGEGPFDVQYETFGTKFIALTATSNLGCKVTKIVELEVGNCCTNPEDLDIVISDKLNVGCENNSTGFIQVEGQGGRGPYLFAIDGGEFSKIKKFDELELGDYEISLIDGKGCESSRIFTIYEGEAINVDAGPDSSVEFLGDSIQLDGTYESDKGFIIVWEPSDSLFCPSGEETCLDPIVVPLGTTSYRLTIIDYLACNVFDEVTIRVENIRPLFAPNAFSPNEDGFNDVFKLRGNTSALASIPLFSIFDRWGNLVFQLRNLSPDGLSHGWDGKLNGVDLDEGVYIWFAEVEYIDPDRPNEVLSGDITLLR